MMGTKQYLHSKDFHLIPYFREQGKGMETLFILCFITLWLLVFYMILLFSSWFSFFLFPLFFLCCLLVGCLGGRKKAFCCYQIGVYFWFILLPGNEQNLDNSRKCPWDHEYKGEGERQPWCRHTQHTRNWSLPRQTYEKQLSIGGICSV